MCLYSGAQRWVKRLSRGKTAATEDLVKKNLGYWMVKLILKVPGARLCRLISHLFYSLAAYLLPFDPAFSNICWDEKEEPWSFAMQNMEMLNMNRSFWSHSIVTAQIFLWRRHHYCFVKAQVTLFPWSKQENILFSPNLNKVKHVLLMLSNERKLSTTEQSTDL